MKRLSVMLALALGTGCATSGGHGGPTVSDADFGRLQSGQTGPVDQARQFAASAKDEQARAKLRFEEVQHEEQLAKADDEVAKAAADRAAAAAKLASESREPAQTEKARALKEQADAQRRAANAHDDYVKKAVAARKAALDVAEKQMALGDARVELAKLQALHQANVAAAGKYDMAKFQRRVDDAQKSFDDALLKLRDKEGQATTAQRAFDDAQHQAQSQAVPLGLPEPTGTGTGR